MAPKVKRKKRIRPRVARADATPQTYIQMMGRTGSKLEGDVLDRTSPHSFSEDQTLEILRSAEVTADELAQLARNPEAMKSRKAMLGLALHCRTPRHVSLPLLRRLFTFDLLQVTLTPAVAADIKRAAENQILLRRESVSIGERISLARRASQRVAGEFLRDEDSRVLSAALDNIRLTEAGVLMASMKPDASELLFKLVAEHSKWSQRREVQIALLRSPKTPAEERERIAAGFSAEALQHLLAELDAALKEEN